jgi:hypothetical protein
MKRGTEGSYYVPNKETSFLFPRVPTAEPSVLERWVPNTYCWRSLLVHVGTKPNFGCFPDDMVWTCQYFEDAGCFCSP